MRILDLQTPAGVYVIDESEDAWGGRTYTASLSGTIWGDFRPGAPAEQATADGDVSVVQAAEFLCQSAEGAARGGLLHLKGFDWRIVSLDEQADGTVRLRIERVHA